MKKEIRVFFTALMYFTRIPCPKWVDHSEEYLNKASKYFPLIGWIVGGFSAAVFCAATRIFPVTISILLSMVASIYITGAFHEDGLADVCDGFGGGWTKEKILLIMKDSRVGAFGVIGLILVLGMKFACLDAISSVSKWHVVFALVAGHSLSRFIAVTFLYTHQYAREGEDSKSRPLATKISGAELFVAALFGIAPLIIYRSYYMFAIIIPVYIVKMMLGAKFKKWIGGYTGDCLGATQQICEVVFYLCLIIPWKYI
jgi:adenosylcobinamide-GDP ribazoletransferase